MILIIFAPANILAKTPLDIIDDDWLEVTTQNFLIVTDMDSKKVRHFAEDLEQFRYYFLKFSHTIIKEDIPPLKIYAFQRTSTYKAFNLPKHSSGSFLYRPSGNYAIANMSGYRTGNKNQNFAQQVLRHEYVHFIFNNNKYEGASPRWYQEGMAEYSSTLRVYNNNLHLGEINVLRLRGVNFRKKVDIEALFKADRIPETRKKGNDFYAHALALVHYCSVNPDLQKQLVAYLGLVGKGESVDDAFREAFEVDFQTLGEETRRYLNKKKFAYYKLELENLYIPENIAINTLTENRLAFHLADLYAAIVSGEEEEREVVVSLLNLSLQDENYEKGPALLLRFHTLLNGEDYQGAKSTFDLMEQQLPDYPGTYDAQADLHTKDMVALLLQGDPDWRKSFNLARRMYRRAIHMDKSFLPAYMGLADIYSKNIDQNIDLNEGIAAFSEVTYFMNHPYFNFQYAILLLRSGKPREARNLLSNVIARAQNEEMVEMTRKLKLGILISD